MKNANVFVDVDLTLVEANGKLFPGVREGLEKMKAKGCHLFLWSSVGIDYAKKVAALHQLTDLFEGYASKPDIIIDDMPQTTVAPFVFNVQEESSWPTMADRIISKHVD
jgi:phosphoglycolate phosphatase-like HAD superfamily hydrolase